MARLTRTQKYASLREQLSNDREVSVSTNDLSKFEDRLKNLEGFPTEDEILNKASEDTIPSFTEVNKEFTSLDDFSNPEGEDSFFDFLSSLDAENIEKAVNETISNIAPVEEIDENKVIEEIDKINIDVEQALSDNFAELLESPESLAELENEPAKEESSISIAELLEESVPNVEPVKEEPTINIVNDNFEDLAEQLMKDNEELNGVVEAVKEEEVVVEPAKVEEETPVEVVSEEPVAAKETLNYFEEDYGDIALLMEEINDAINGTIEPVKEEETAVEPAKAEEPVVEETPITEEVLEVEETTEELVVEETPAVEEISEEVINDIANIVDGVEEPTVEEIKKDIAEIVESNEEPAIEEEPEFVEEPVVEVNNSYVDATLKEVAEYNKNDGLKTIDDISKTMIDSIRHPEAEKKEMDDDEFSNTVSLEINKVLSEMKMDSTVSEPEVKIETPVKNEEVSPELFAEKIAETIEHPVLTKALEEEVVEIKSMEETLRQDVLNDTIPFVMNNEEEEYEDDDDAAPNKVLNVILVILIVILLAILGVILYYILFAKGIIG